VTNDLFAVFGVSPGNVYAGGANGVILHATDGKTFTAEPSSTTAPITSFWAASASDVYAAGENGTLLHSTGNGSSGMVVGMHDGGAFAPDMGGQGGSCLGGTVAVSGPITGFDTDGTFIYYVTSSNTAGKIPLCGGSEMPFTEASALLSNPGALAMRGNDVYFINQHGATNPDGGNGMAIIHTDSSGNLRNSAVGVGSFGAPGDTYLVTDEQANVYWLSSNSIESSSPTDAQTTLASTNGDGRSICVDSGNVYWAGFTPSPAIYSVPRGSVFATPAPLTPVPATIKSAYATPTLPGVWYTDEQKGSVFQGGNAMAIGTIPGPFPAFGVTDGANLYIATFAGSNDSLYKLSTTGGSPMGIGGGLSGPTYFRIDGNFVYVLDKGVIQRFLK
jgi:hypothetical protein